MSDDKGKVPQQEMRVGRRAYARRVRMPDMRRLHLAGGWKGND